MIRRGIFLRLGLSLFAAILFAQSSIGQVIIISPAVNVTVIPNPALSGQVLRFTAGLPSLPSCLNELQVNDITVAGNTVTVLYTVQATSPPQLCLGTPPPITFSANIGPFSAGDYSATAIGDYRGLPIPPFSIAFSVTDSAVPTLASRNVALLSLLLPIMAISFGACRQQRPSVNRRS